MNSQLYGSEVLTVDQLAAVGHVAIQSGNVEQLLISRFGDSFKDKQLSAMLTTVKVLVDEKLKSDSNARYKFDDLYNASKKTLLERNIIMHGRPYEDRTSESGALRVWFASVRYPNEAVLADDVIQTAYALKRLETQLENFFMFYGDAIR